MGNNLPSKTKTPPPTPPKEQCMKEIKNVLVGTRRNVEDVDILDT